MVSVPAPRKAEKKRVKLKMAVQGPSGSGKTWGALALAKNLWPEAKICLIDTENESASLYADRFEFDTIPLGPPFGTDRYIACIDAAVKAGYDLLIIDSITPQWDGEGGILRRKEQMDRNGGNSFTNFATFTPEHERFKNAILQSPLHIIATMRSKQEYALQQNDKGKQTPVKMGMAPIQRDGMDYEFAIVFDVQGNHLARASKDRTGLFISETVDLADPKTAEALRAWLDSGVAVTPLPTQPVSGAAISTQAGNTSAPPSQSPAQTVSTPTQNSSPVTRQRVWDVVGDTLYCEPLATELKGNRVVVKLDRPFNGSIYAGCFHKSLHECLLACADKQCLFKFTVSTKDDKTFTNIEDVLCINGDAYEKGKMVNPNDEFNQEPRTVDGHPITDDIPF